MKRRLLNVLTALSLLVCVAVCLLWARSYGLWEGVSRSDLRPDRLTYAHGSLNSSSGILWFHGGRGKLSGDAAAYEEDAARRRGEPRPRRAAWLYSSHP